MVIINNQNNLVIEILVLLWTFYLRILNSINNIVPNNTIYIQQNKKALFWVSSPKQEHSCICIGLERKCIQDMVWITYTPWFKETGTKQDHWPLNLDHSRNASLTRFQLLFPYMKKATLGSPGCATYARISFCKPSLIPLPRFWHRTMDSLPIRSKWSYLWVPD